MRTGRPIPPLEITASEHEALEAMARGEDRRLGPRASAILLSAEGLSNKNVASRCGMTKQTVGKWRSRFRTRRVEGLRDDPRPGAPRRITDEQVEGVLRMASQRAPNGSPWTTRSLAEAMGLTQTAVSRIWRMHGVKPAAGGPYGNGHANGGGNGNGHGAAAPSSATFSAGPKLDQETQAQTRKLGAIHSLLRDARSLRGAGSPELDPLLALAIDAIERALEKQREPVRARYARAETALRNARNLLLQAEAVARSAERTREVAANAALVATRSVSDDLETLPGDTRKE
jgi:transposase